MKRGGAIGNLGRAPVPEWEEVARAAWPGRLPVTLTTAAGRGHLVVVVSSLAVLVVAAWLQLPWLGLVAWTIGAAGEWLATCTIITTRAADAVGHIHDRMPMTVPPDRWDAWLDPTLTDGACDLLQPPGAALEAYAVSRLVSTVGNDGAELIEPLHES